MCAYAFICYLQYDYVIRAYVHAVLCRYLSAIWFSCTRESSDFVHVHLYVCVNPCMLCAYVYVFMCLYASACMREHMYIYTHT